MQNLSSVGENIVRDLAMRYQLSEDAVVHMLIAVNNGGGTMAQFNCPELGGSGQWMQGGMTMVGDMFNGRLQARVDSLCSELSQVLANNRVFPEAPQNNSWQWWPAELGEPFSSGAQNNQRYALFPQQRLAVENNGQVTIYDTLDHQIGGVSQQQGGSNSLSFTSQHGIVAIEGLPIVSNLSTDNNVSDSNVAPFGNQVDTSSQGQSGPAFAPQQETSAASAPHGNDAREAIELIEKCAQLYAAGVLTEEEFEAKKRELISRI